MAHYNVRVRIDPRNSGGWCEAWYASGCRWLSSAGYGYGRTPDAAAEDFACMVREKHPAHTFSVSIAEGGK